MNGVPKQYEFGPSVRIRAEFGLDYKIDLVVESRLSSKYWKEVARFDDTVDPEALSKAVATAQAERRRLIEGE